MARESLRRLWICPVCRIGKRSAEIMQVETRLSVVSEICSVRFRIKSDAEFKRDNDGSLSD